MIKIINRIENTPYSKLYHEYEKAVKANQQSIDALCISSYDEVKKIVDSRFVNLKLIDNEKFIFFTNYESPKSIQFQSHRQIAAVIFWNKINLQIRIKAYITKTDIEFNQSYFKDRSSLKNALAISSKQSNQIESFSMVEDQFIKTKENSNLTKCPSYWGGFTFVPFEIEFWEGNKFRLNKRNLYKKDQKKWNHFILEP
jgi:pyridoxamine 5'-phosphate oxidase